MNFNLLGRKKSSKKPKITMPSLNHWNRVLAGLHFVQGVAVILLSKGVTFPVTTNYLTADSLATKASGQPVLAPASRHLLDINLAYLVAAFFFMSAVAHLLIATKYRKKYEKDLKKGINKVRWIEYGVSASTMLVAIAIIAGIYDLSSLIMIFGFVLVMNLLGLAMEVYNQEARKVNWLAYVIGAIAGIIPWVAYAIYVAGSSVYGASGPPTFVYFILVSIFLLFNGFAVNMYLQYKKKGNWADYLYGERVYMILSLVAKTALAWQVFFGTLRP